MLVRVLGKILLQGRLRDRTNIDRFGNIDILTSNRSCFLGSNVCLNLHFCPPCINANISNLRARCLLKRGQFPVAENAPMPFKRAEDLNLLRVKDLDG